MTNKITIGNVEIGDSLPPLLIAEIGLNHNGNIDLAKELIYMAARSGAHVVKFQKRSPEDLAIASFLDSPFSKCPLFGKTQREVRTRLELTCNQICELKKYAESLNLMFSMSVFDLPSLVVAQKADLDFIKIASHSITNGPFLKEVAKTEKPLFVSMGAASWEERDIAFNILKNNPIVIMHCTSAYPCTDNLVNLGTITKLKERYNCIIGYSGHEVDTLPSTIAVAMGARVIERHFTLNKSMVGLDHQISLTPEEFSILAKDINRVPKLLGTVNKILPEEMPARTNYHVSVCSRKPIRKGQIITLEDVCCKQPLGEEGKFFNGMELDKLIGKKSGVDIPADTPISVSSILHL